MTATSTGPSTSMRLSALAIVILSLVGALTARLWFLTAVEGENSVQAAEANRTRVLHIQAPRGRIMDRNRNILVDNVQVRQLRVDSRALDEAVEYDDEARTAIYTQLADALNLYEVPVQADDVVKGAEVRAEAEALADGASEDDARAAGEAAAEETELRIEGATAIDGTAAVPWDEVVVRGALTNNFEGPYLPTPVADGVPEELEILLAENQLQYPGVDVEPVAERYYPYGSLAAHVLGYVKPLTEEDLERPEILEADKEYAPGDDIGKSGVELSYEDHLRGTPGRRIIEVDAQGDIVREVDYDPPIPGDDLMLELDLGIQMQFEQQLAAQAEANEVLGASGVVMDPSDGSILAMASVPTFSPAELSGRISQERFAELTDTELGAALTNKAIAGQYPAGSTWKPVTAVAAMRAGLLQPEEVYVDNGVYTVEGCEGESCEFQNPDQQPLGPVNLAQSLTVSSDTYYYRLGDQLWGARERVGEDFLQETAHDFGFAEETEVDLPAAVDGSLWTPAILSEHCQENPELCFEGADQTWKTGDTINMSIGQGYVQVTPLQLANMYAALANGGTLHTPHVGGQVLSPQLGGAEPTWEVAMEVNPEPLGTVEMPGTWRDAIVQGLLGVPQAGTGGTAASAFEGFDLGAFPVAGKTGTAQKDEEEDYGLFAGFGPVRPGEVPQYVVATVFEAGGQFGGTIAAPPVRAVFDYIVDPSVLPPYQTYPASPVPSTGELTAGGDVVGDS